MKIANTRYLTIYREHLQTRDECRTRKGRDYWHEQAQLARRKHNQIIMLRELGLLDGRAEAVVRSFKLTESEGSKIFPEFLEDEE